MSKYLKIFWRIARMSWRQNMLYSADFVFGSVSSLMWFVTQVFYIDVFYRAGGVTEVGGYSQADIYLVLILGQLVYAVIFAFIYDNVKKLRNQIFRGELDKFLLKPVNTMFISVFQSVSLRQWVIIIFYVLVFTPYLFFKYDYHLTLEMFGQIVFVVVMGIILLSCLFLVAGLIYFFWPKFDVFWRIVWDASDFYRWPKTVYPEWIQLIMTFVVPLFVLVNPIYNVLDGSFNWSQASLVLLMTALFVALSGWMWREGLKKYNSAN